MIFADQKQLSEKFFCTAVFHIGTQTDRKRLDSCYWFVDLCVVIGSLIYDYIDRILNSC